MDQRIILTFESYRLINIDTFHKAKAAIDSDPYVVSGQSPLKTLERIHLLDTFNNICVSWGEVQISILTGV